VDLDEFMARSNARARRGRRTARVLFGVGIYIVLLFVVLFVAAPNTMGGGPSTAVKALILAGAGAMLFGLAWMWRILRADPEPDSRSWRYRR
jgi:putative copper export protein